MGLTFRFVRYRSFRKNARATDTTRDGPLNDSSPWILGAPQAGPQAEFFFAMRLMASISIGIERAAPETEDK